MSQRITLEDARQYAEAMARLIAIYLYPYLPYALHTYSSLHALRW